MPEAARFGDPIEHTNAMVGLLVGIAAGALIGALVVGTGGGALVLAAGIAGGAAAGGGIGEVLGSLDMAGGSVTGSIQSGSPDIFINGRRAARCHDTAGDRVDCDGPRLGLSRHALRYIAQGSETVSFNLQPAARLGDLSQCSAKIGEGSPDVIVGGATITTMDLEGEVPDWIHTTLLVVGVASAVILAGPVVAAFGLAGSYAGGALGNWVGGRLFGEGSDGQKLTGLLGSFIGGSRGAKAGVKPAAWLGNKIGGSAGGFTRAGVPGIGGKAQQVAQQQATSLRNRLSNNKLNKVRATSAAVDRTNGKSWVESSGKPNPSEIHPDLQSRYPPGSRSLEDWHIENCAEFKATNRALHDGAKIENLDIATVRTKTGEPMPRCNNCLHTTDGARVSTDNAQYRTPGGIIGGSNTDARHP